MNSEVPASDPMHRADLPDGVKHVLVVDDSRAQRRILSSSLKRWGYHVTEADSGEAALAICQQDTPDLILSDWMMPGMSGLDFCKAFRALSDETYSYFILLTSKSETDDIAEGLDAGADDFLTKPVNPPELRARLSAGQRIIEMQQELTLKNRVIKETLVELQRLYDSLDSDLVQAKQLQQSLIREREKTFDGGDLALLLQSSGHVGGDLVGFFPASDGHLGLFAIDVSGHGISSALMTARLAGYLSATAPDQNIALEKTDTGYRSRAPRDAIAILNQLVLDEMETEHYFTMMLADIDMETGRVVIGQAGHPHPVVQRADGTLEQDGTGGFPVGLMPNVSFSQFEIQLSPGDRLLILSDGVTECPDTKGALLEEEGLEKILNDLQSVKGPALFTEILAAMTKLSGLTEFPDDVSGLLFEFHGAGQAK
ncbi:SpoIIE family protein phosphatase [Roseobacter sp.]|uniref:SpoIIE family protein phosphatase n=1 Tax=Roseobacter sp. TaxID=1907202 RepID=UPI003296A5DD